MLFLLRRCFLALVLVLCSTSHAVGGRPTSTVATRPQGVNTPPKHSYQVHACPPSCLCILMPCPHCCTS